MINIHTCVGLGAIETHIHAACHVWPFVVQRLILLRGVYLLSQHGSVAMASHDDGDLAAIVAMADPQLFGDDAGSDVMAMQSERSGGQDDLALLSGTLSRRRVWLSYLVWPTSRMRWRCVCNALGAVRCITSVSGARGRESALSVCQFRSQMFML